MLVSDRVLSVLVEGIAVPEPVLVSIAAAVAGRAVAGLYQLIKAKFADDPDASAVLEAAEGAAADSKEVGELAAALEEKQGADPAFGERLREEWDRVTVEQNAGSGGVANQVSGQVGGNVVQARDIQGGISF
ncbi:hypothetical protein [Amycolatopsis keratiniphila]|uniref:hypothetical protein n=1 Tax=Amycolatopsis keratiniphila TaxID=129921 RepID=UPI000ADC26B4|nr:hypothetical protein [Amycolatopsis keratiniphila]